MSTTALRSREGETSLPASGAPGSRIHGLDIARGIAILGMFAAHILLPQAEVGPDPDTWIGIVNGRSAALFAVLAGVSVALLSGRTRPAAGPALLEARLRIGTRALLIFALGSLLDLADHGIAVILEYYALGFLLLLPLLRWRPRNLFILAAVISVVGPIVQTAIALVLEDQGRSSHLTLLLFYGYYPMAVWIVFLLIGLGLGRLDLGSARMPMRLVPWAIALIVIGYGSGMVLTVLTGVEAASPIIGFPQWSNLLGAAAHSGSPSEILGATGVAVLVIAGCLALPRAARLVLTPIAATGRMALTAYSAHLVALAVIRERGIILADPIAEFWWFTILALIICTAWIGAFRSGPLEKLLTRLSRAAASVPGPGRPSLDYK